MNVLGTGLLRSMLRPAWGPWTMATGLAAMAAIPSSVLPASGVVSAGEATTPHSVSSENARLSIAEGLSDGFRSAAEQVLPSVVEIKVSVPRTVPLDTHSQLPDYEGYPVEEYLEDNESETDVEPSERVIGCGVIIDSSGIVLTNYHVVEEAGEMLVGLPDGRLFKVKDVRKDEQTDLAVLSVDCPDPLPAARLGDSENLRIGDWVLSIGSPFELEQTVSAGIISAKGRSVRGAGRTRLLQTDAAINPGSSGGALVNLRGELVGITTAIASEDGGYQGVGFAVPINLAKWVSAELRQHGRVRRGYSGVSTTRPTSHVTNRARAFDRNVLVSGVMQNSPAYKARVRVNDTILSFDGRPVRSGSELFEVVEQVTVGSKHKLEILRGGTPQTLEVTIEEAPAARQAASSSGDSDVDGSSELVYSHDLELTAGNLGRHSRGQLGMRTAEGVLVVRVDRGGAAFGAGIRRGMVIVRVGDRPVRNTDDFAEVMESQSLEKGISLQVLSDQGTRTIIVGNP